jgi:small multidrug resistance pump
MQQWTYLAIAIVSEVAATSALKASEGLSKLWPSVVVLVGYGISFYFLSLTLKSVPIGIAYAIWSGAGIAMLTFIGWFFFGQKLDLPAFLGLALIVAGVIVLNLYSNVKLHA